MFYALYMISNQFSKEEMLVWYNQAPYFNKKYSTAPVGLPCLYQSPHGVQLARREAQEEYPEGTEFFIRKVDIVIKEEL